MTEAGGIASFTFQAEVIRVQTMESGALRVVLDLPEHQIPQAAMLMECKTRGIPLLVEVKADS